MRPPRPLALVVVRHAAFLAAVDLDIGGIQVNRDRPFGRRCRPCRGQQLDHPPGDRCQSRLHRQPLPAGDPAGHARSRRRRQARYRGELLASRIRAVAVQRGQEILPGQLRCCQPVSSSPPNPRSRSFTGPTAASSSPITFSRSHSPVIAASAAFGVSARSGAPTRTCRRFRFPPHILATR
jgi:hypothetical protein